MTKSKGIRKPYWLPQEDEVVKELWDSHTSREIMRQLPGRSRGAITARATKALGLSKGGSQMSGPGMFWRFVRKDVATGCWLWTGTLSVPGIRTKGGYGMMGKSRGRGGYWTAHRYSLFLHNGRLPRDKDVLHKCDNPPCCNPDHLYLGNDSDNQMDTIRRRRRPLVLSEDLVRQARVMFARGMKKVSISRALGVSRGALAAALTNKSWRWLK